MSEKLIDSILLAFILLGCMQVLRYFYLVWFRSDEYLQQAENNMRKWQKKQPNLIGGFGKPPPLRIARLIMTFVFLGTLPIFIAILSALFIIWFK